MKKTLAEYYCRPRRVPLLPRGFLAACLRFNPRLLFTAVGLIAIPMVAAPISPARPTAGTLLDRIAFIESSNRSDCIGDNGRARGAYQMHLAAVIDCGGTKADWIALTNRATADRFAGAYLNIIQTKLAKAGIKQASPAQVYQIWNCGYTAAKRTGFDPSKAPTITRKAIGKL
jgi:hypothetical protein